jgi:hypothetical protein
MKIHRFAIVAALLNSAAFAQTNASSPLTVHEPGIVNPYVLLKSDATGNPYGFLQYDQSEGNFMRLYDGSAFSMVWRAGNVGIATTTPSSRLSVNGNINADGFNATGGVQQFYSDGGVYLAGHGGSAYSALQAYSNTSGSGKWLALNPSGGNVGIGTTTPATSLDVRGNGGGITGNSLYFYGSGVSGDGFPYARITEYYGMRFTSPDSRWVFSTKPSLLVGYAPDGRYWGEDNLLVAGNVGIGTTNPAHKLAVNGTIKAKEVIVETTGWSDYVFADGYALQPLSQVEAHIKEHKHLPGIPSAATVATTGVNVGDMQAALLAKVEELTLHLIAQEKELSRLRETEKQITALRAEVTQLRQTK